MHVVGVLVREQDGVRAGDDVRRVRREHTGVDDKRGAVLLEDDAGVLVLVSFTVLAPLGDFNRSWQRTRLTVQSTTLATGGGGGGGTAGPFRIMICDF